MVGDEGSNLVAPVALTGEAAVQQDDRRAGAKGRIVDARAVVRRVAAGCRRRQGLRIGQGLPSGRRLRERGAGQNEREQEPGEADHWAQT